MMTSSNGNISAWLAPCAGNSPVPVTSPHKGQWRGALFFSLFCARINGWVNNRAAGDLRRHRGQYDVIWMNWGNFGAVRGTVNRSFFSKNPRKTTRPFGRGMAYHLFVHILVYILPQPESLQWYMHYQIILDLSFSYTTFQWRHNERDSVSNHQSLGCLLSCLFRRRSKKTSKLRVTGRCAGNSPWTDEFPAQMANKAENVSIWWRHHDIYACM